MILELDKLEMLFGEKKMEKELFLINGLQLLYPPPNPPPNPTIFPIKII